VVHRALVAERAAVGLARDERREQGVLRRPACAAGDPPGGAERAGLPYRTGKPDRACREPGYDVTAGRERAAAPLIVRRGPSGELGDARKPVADPLDQPERPGRAAERMGDEARENRGRDLVPGVAKEAGNADTRDAAAEPALLLRAV
jgi:hypothetical protein